MLERLLVLKTFCIKHHDEKDFKKLHLTDEAWESFASLSKVLQAPGKATKQLQDEQLLVSDAVCHWLVLVGKLRKLSLSLEEKEETRTLAEKLLELIETR